MESVNRHATNQGCAREHMRMGARNACEAPVDTWCALTSPRIVDEYVPARRSLCVALDRAVIFLTPSRGCAFIPVHSLENETRGYAKDT